MKKMNVLYFSIQAFVRRSVLLSVLSYVCVISATAQEADDSLMVVEQGFRPQQLIVPSALIAVGAFGVNNGWFCSVKEQVRDGFQDLRGDCRFKVDNYLQYLPAAATLGLEYVGAKAKHPIVERVAATATAYVAMTLMVNATKYTVKEKRPDSGSRNSFPSGHTATAFVGAELVREEYGNGYGACAYTIATGVAVLRLYNDRHWLNDIIAGAGTGILAARIGYWLLPWERKVFGMGKSKAAVAVLPSYDYTNKGFGVSMAANF